MNKNTKKKKKWLLAQREYSRNLSHFHYCLSLLANLLNRDDSIGKEPTWRLAEKPQEGRKWWSEEPGRSIWETRGEGVFEAESKCLGGEDKDHAAEATEELNSRGSPLGEIWCPEDSWQSLQTFWVLTIRDGVLLHLVGSSQGCSWYCAMHRTSPPNKELSSSK